MSLIVEVAGVGVCRGPSTVASYSLFVVAVQQEAYQGWTVYRRYQSFVALYEHLRMSLLPSGINVLQLPHCDPNNIQIPYLENCAANIDVWLKSMAAESVILRTQFMYQFLCMDANLPPPYLEIHWKRGYGHDNRFDDARNSNYDVMDDMDDVFDKHISDDVFMDDSSSQSNRSNLSSLNSSYITTDDSRGWNAMGAQAQAARPITHTAQHYIHNNPSHMNNMTSGNKRGYEGNDDDDENDGLDILSLSVVEAEFLYDKSTDSKANKQMKASNESFASSDPSGAQHADQRVFVSGNDSNVIAVSSTGDITTHPHSSSPAPSPGRPKRKINLDSFHIIKVIGKGSFGKVFLVREKSTNIPYALKVLKKEYIIKKNQVEHTLTERSVLGLIHHPYIVGLNMAFQTSDKLFFVLDYCSGGELFFHLGKIGRFSEERAKFYAAQIILALEYVHSLDIIYRDLKPENVLLDAAGNVRLTDFGLSKEGVSNHSTGAFSFCGTPEYIAPEVLLRQGHGRAVDWWSLGALLYEMISGLPPFYSRNRETMFEKIMKAELAFPPFMSDTAKDLLSKFLIRDPKLRLGSGERDAMEVKEHPFFKDIDWDGLYHGRVVAPWTPAVVGSVDTSQFDQEFTSMNPAVSPEVRGAYFGSVDRTFEGFSFVDESAAHFMNQHVNISTSSASSYKNNIGFSMLSSTINSAKKHY